MGYITRVPDLFDIERVKKNAKRKIVLCGRLVKNRRFYILSQFVRRQNFRRKKSQRKVNLEKVLS